MPVKLVIHGPRGPKPSRLKKAVVGSAHKSPASNPGVLEQGHPSSDMTDSSLDGNLVIVQQHIIQVKPHHHNGDLPLGDFEMVDQALDDNEEVDEGEIDYDEEIEKDESLPGDEGFADEDNDGAKTVISLSSDGADESQDAEFVMNMKPWALMNRGLRAQLEVMYAQVEIRLLGHQYGQPSTEQTELYQYHKDLEMVRYIQDYPLEEWVIGEAAAQKAYLAMMDRTRWRRFDVGIFPHAGPSAQAGPPFPSTYPQGPLPNVTMRGPPPGMPPSGMMATYPSQILRSQPHAQAMNFPPGHPMAQSPATYMSTLPMSFPPQQLPQQHIGHGHTPVNTTQPEIHPPPPKAKGQSKGQSKGKGKQKKDSPRAPTPPPPPPTPPYTKHEKPVEVVEDGKKPRRATRRPAECKKFPWHRDGIDFIQAKQEAYWDDSAYDEETLAGMQFTRESNKPIVESLDHLQADKQRDNRNRKKNAAQARSETPSSEVDGDGEPAQRSQTLNATSSSKNNMQGDPYHTGNFAFATPADQKRAQQLGKKTPDDILDDAAAGKIDWDLCAAIQICWNPGKKGTTQDLEQAVFSIRDILVTRAQVANMPVLTARAAERIIDFCPDMLYREMLLRMRAEAGLTNKDIRDRACLNGCWCDKATITKRISAALGQKQEPNTMRNRKKAEEQALAAGGGEGSEPKAKKTWKTYNALDNGRIGGYFPGEQKWFDDNVQDFYNYVAFFGNRNQRSLLRVGYKRQLTDEMASDGSFGETGRGSKRARTEETEAASTPAGSDAQDTDMEINDGETTEEEDEVDEVDDEDAVSEQDSDILDEIED